MGSFYVSHLLRGPSRAQVLSWLDDRPAFVSKTVRGSTVVLDAACESQNGEEIAALSSSLSAHFHCPVLAILNHDDDILYFEVYENGQKTDEYNSTPGYFGDGDAAAGPTGGGATHLASLFGATDSTPVERALRNADYAFATDRHRDLAAALGLPAFSVGVGYTYVEAGDLPPAVTPDTYRHSGQRRSRGARRRKHAHSRLAPRHVELPRPDLSAKEAYQLIQRIAAELPWDVTAVSLATIAAVDPQGRMHTRMGGWGVNYWCPSRAVYLRCSLFHNGNVFWDSVYPFQAAPDAEIREPWLDSTDIAAAIADEPPVGDREMHLGFLRLIPSPNQQYWEAHFSDYTVDADIHHKKSLLLDAESASILFERCESLKKGRRMDSWQRVRSSEYKADGQELDTPSQDEH